MGASTSPENFSGTQVAGLQGKGLTRRMTQALEFDDFAGGGGGRAARLLRFHCPALWRRAPWSRGETAAGHLLGVAHQFIKVNFGAATKVPMPRRRSTFLRVRARQSVARGHEAT